MLDSDYMVAPDWLRCMVPHFANPQVGFVQSPQDYRDNDGSFFKRLMFWEYAGFFQLGMVTRNERNAIIQHGTMTPDPPQPRWPMSAAGPSGPSPRTPSSGCGCSAPAGEAVYSSRSFGRGVMPDDFAAYRKQRFRWAYGAMQICRRHCVGAAVNPFNRDLTLGQRWHFVTGWLPWVGDALGLCFLVLGLGWSVGLIVAPMRFEFPIVLFMLPSIGLFVFKLAQILRCIATACRAASRTGSAPRSPAWRLATPSARRCGRAWWCAAPRSCARRRWRMPRPWCRAW